MNKKFVSLLLAFSLTCGALPLSNAPTQVFSVSASDTDSLTYEDLTYVAYTGYVKITGCDTSATEVVIPSEINGLPVIMIGDGAFYSCKDLTSISIPSSVSNIGDGVFSGCSSLTSINLPSETSKIGSGAFSGCTSLTSLIIPDSVMSIGDGAFTNCSSLTSITIPKNVASIGNYAFAYCTALKKVLIVNPECEIADSNVTISNSFDSTQNLYLFDGIIYGYSDSTAQAYAEKYSRKFMILSDEDLTTTTTTTTTAPTTSTSTPDKTLFGDANCNGTISIADAILILQYISNSNAYPLDSQALKNSDVYLNGDGINAQDALSIQKYEAHQLTELPESYMS